MLLLDLDEYVLYTRSYSYFRNRAVDCSETKFKSNRKKNQTLNIFNSARANTSISTKTKHLLTNQCARVCVFLSIYFLVLCKIEFQRWFHILFLKCRKNELWTKVFMFLIFRHFFQACVADMRMMSSAEVATHLHVDLVYFKKYLLFTTKKMLLMWCVNKWIAHLYSSFDFTLTWLHGHWTIRRFFGRK